MAFPDNIEKVFNADTAAARVAELRLTVPFGLSLFLIMALVDPVFVPDLGWTGMALRSIVFPSLLYFLVAMPGMSPRLREWFITLCVITAFVSLSIIATMSASPYGSFILFAAVIGLIYVNTTLPLRSTQARVTTAFACGILVLGTFGIAQLNVYLKLAIAVHVLIACAFSLMANYRIERGFRLSYLLSVKERLRLLDLTADREKFATLSQTDRLTGLANRVLWDQQSTELFDNPQNDGLPIGLLMIDVDYFKRYNDHYGHSAGDACLRAIAETLLGAVHGHNDLVVRFGGEEFVVMLPNATETKAYAIANHLRREVAAHRIEHANRSDDTRIVTISIGVAHMIVGNGSTASDALEQADQALYAAKRLGRNRVATRNMIAA